ncbi:GvpL/GvpF family gas vesicle protein [Streptomyces sp. NPDC047022]|uniref:GvpL/GvpF family gas vesicle protein n=1 Tax=Streptomyces sp. NPDC047022 TaxID=3155737 RepID=UPI0033C7DF77
MPTYVYGITRADHPLRLEGVHGVGEPATALRAVRTDTLAAVVSDAPEALRAKRRDVRAHQGVLEALMADGATLPMRFGHLAPDDDQVTAALDAESDGYRARLAQLDGHVEYSLKVARDEDDLLREIVMRSGPVRELRERTLADPAAHEERLALGEMVSHEVDARRASEGEELRNALTPNATSVSVGEAGGGHLLSLSFLVRNEETAAFVRAVQREADRRGDAYTFTLTGPLPPYSFV